MATYDEKLFQDYFKLYKKTQREQGSVLSGRYGEFFIEREANVRAALKDMSPEQATLSLEKSIRELGGKHKPRTPRHRTSMKPMIDSPDLPFTPEGQPGRTRSRYHNLEVTHPGNTRTSNKPFLQHAVKITKPSPTKSDIARQIRAGTWRYQGTPNPNPFQRNEPYGERIPVGTVTPETHLAYALSKPVRIRENSWIY